MENIIETNNPDKYLQIDTVTIFMLLFADNAVLMSKTANGLQNLLDKMCIYCNKWKLTVNISKTKACIFEKRKSKTKPKFMYYGQVLENVDSFTYLGTTLQYTNNFKAAIKTMSEQGMKA